MDGYTKALIIITVTHNFVARRAHRGSIDASEVIV